MGNLPGMAYRCSNDSDWTLEFVSEGAHAADRLAARSLAVRRGALCEPDPPDDRDRSGGGPGRLAHDQPFELTYRITTAQGLQKWVWERGSAVRGADGAVLALEGFISDITERRRAEDEVARLNAELEERVRQRTAQLEAANAELEAFSYSIAHDLRSPLTSIDGFSHTLEEMCGGSLGEQARHYVNRIRAGVRQMSDLTEAMLSLARLSRVKLRWEAVDWRRWRDRRWRSLREAQPRREPRWRPRPPVGPGRPALADPGGGQPAGQRLEVFRAASRRRASHRQRRGEDGEPVYFVADNGAGFDMAHAARLFGAFQRLHAPANSRAPASAWRWCRRSSRGTAAASGRKPARRRRDLLLHAVERSALLSLVRVTRGSRLAFISSPAAIVDADFARCAASSTNARWNSSWPPG